VKTKTFR